MRKVLLYLAGPCALLILFAGLALGWYRNAFDAGEFKAENVMAHVEELSSAKYAGRLAGTAGNELALMYVEQRLREIGVAPAGDKGTYYQNFKSMIPLFKSEPHFQVRNQRGSVVREYAHGIDYLEVMNNYGRGGRLEGSLLFLAKDISMYEPRELKDQIIVRPGLMDKDIAYAIDNGVKGILILTANGEGQLVRQAISISAKQGGTVPILALTEAGFQTLEEYARQGLQVDINLDVAYQTVETPNLLGKIEGQDKNSVVIISAHIDHVGSTFSGRYFPGALDGASGVGMLLELARVMKAQNIVPEKTVLFAVWNSQEYGMNGSRYYVEHPLYPLDKTQVLVLNLLGGNKSNGVILDSSGKLGKVYTGKLAQFFAQNGMGARETLDGRGDDHAPFLTKGVPSVRVTSNLNTAYSQSLGNLHTYNDNVDSIDAGPIQFIGLGLLEYIQAEIYQDVYPRYLTFADKLFLALYALGLAWIYVIYTLNKINP
ncbi:MAG TPA: M28 family peptidase, partial [Verrucomicrobiae bacterium]|nr:M28 family peptidase [Verrucomicrobiae bacterium]